jgi:hypothetical protein
MADRLARQASAMPLLGPEPALGIPKCQAREAIKSWTKHQYSNTWKIVPGCRQGKLFIDRPCKKRANDLLKLGRHQLKMAVAILTGHAPVRGHLQTMACTVVIHPADSAGWRLKQCSISLVAARHWLNSAIIFLGNRLLNQKKQAQPHLGTSVSL